MRLLLFSIHNICCTFILKSFHNSFFFGWINYFKGILSDDGSAENQDDLISLEDTQLALNHILKAAEHLWEFTSDLMDSQCEAMGENTMCIGASLGLVCAPNPPKIICSTVKVVIKWILYSVLLAATIAFQAIDHIFAKASMSR